MTVLSIVNDVNDIMKSVAPHMLAQPAFKFIYDSQMVKLRLNYEAPVNKIGVDESGNLIVVRSYTTAFVAFDQKGRNVAFQFNKYFAESLQDIERFFIFCHEAMHVLLNHGERGNAFLETLPKDQRSRKILNKAMDVCINEILKNQLFKDYYDYMDIYKEVCTIATMFEKHGVYVEEGKDFKYYYFKMLEMMKNNTYSDDDGMTFGDAMDFEEIPDWAKEKIKEIVEKNGFDEEKIEKFLKENKEKKEGIKGDVAEKVVTQFKKMNVQDAIMRYVKQRNMSKIDSTVAPKVKYNWYGLDRRNASFKSSYKNMNMPTKNVTYKFKKMKVVLYCDVSPSVDAYTKKFLAIIDLINTDRSEVIPYAWANNVSLATKIGEDKYKWSGVGHGTNINAVLQHYEENYVNDEVDAVIVLTDGEYNDINKYKLKNKADHTKWIFFMTDSRYIRNVIDKSTSVEIDWAHYKG